MQVEYEATFLDVNKDEFQKRLKEAGAVLVRPEFLQKRVVFNLPLGHEIKGGWLRVRDEVDKITMSLKVVDGEEIKNQKEICLLIDDFQKAEQFLIAIGCRKKAYQENKRELWDFKGVEVTIDEWPFLEPFAEIEGDSEEKVKETALALGFEYKNAYFCAVDIVYSKKYNISKEAIDKTPLIVFDMKNPFQI